MRLGHVSLIIKQEKKKILLGAGKGAVGQKDTK